MAAMSIYGKNTWKCSSPEPRKLWGWILVYNIEDSKLYQVCSNDDHRLTFDLFTAMSNLRLYRFVLGVWWRGWGDWGGGVEKTFFFFFFFFFQYVFKINDRNLQCMIKVVKCFVRIKILPPPLGVICPCPCAIYRYKTMKSLNVFFSKTTWPIFTRFHKRPSVEGMLTICSNGSVSLNKMAAMLIYGKNT